MIMLHVALSLPLPLPLPLLLPLLLHPQPSALLSQLQGRPLGLQPPLPPLLLPLPLPLLPLLPPLPLPPPVPLPRLLPLRRGPKGTGLREQAGPAGCSARPLESQIHVDHLLRHQPSRLPHPPSLPLPLP